MISVFDIYKVGIGPSSSHTVGPMRAAKELLLAFQSEGGKLAKVSHVQVELYGSLGQTGKGHGTGKAVILGLAGESPETCDTSKVDDFLAEVDKSERLSLLGKHEIEFPRAGAIQFHRRKTMPKHANAMEIRLYDGENLLYKDLYYSIGGGFIVSRRRGLMTRCRRSHRAKNSKPIPYAFDTATEMVQLCKTNGMRISSLMLANEKIFSKRGRDQERLNAYLAGPCAECNRNRELRPKESFGRTQSSVAERPVFINV